MAKRKTKTNKIHYVDNAKFLEAMIEYKGEYYKRKKIIKSFHKFQNIWDRYF